MDAVILCGGLGTRLRSVVQDVPKPMAPIRNKPFLEYLLNSIVIQNKFSSIILCVGYKHEQIINYFGDNYCGIPIKYSIEDSPLGTGGAIKKAVALVSDKKFILINGDTLFMIDYNELILKSLDTKTDIIVALKKMQNFDRYGTVVINDDTITEFNEKKFVSSGLINGGTYLLNKEIFDKFNFPEKFSFEKDILEKHIACLSIKGVVFDGYFIDIGIPDDFEKANKELIMESSGIQFVE